MCRPATPSVDGAHNVTRQAPSFEANAALYGSPPLLDLAGLAYEDPGPLKRPRSTLGSTPAVDALIKPDEDHKDSCPVCDPYGPPSAPHINDCPWSTLNSQSKNISMASA